MFALVIKRSQFVIATFYTIDEARAVREMIENTADDGAELDVISYTYPETE